MGSNYVDVKISFTWVSAKGMLWPIPVVRGKVLIQELPKKYKIKVDKDISKSFLRAQYVIKTTCTFFTKKV